MNSRNTFNQNLSIFRASILKPYLDTSVSQITDIAKIDIIIRPIKTKAIAATCDMG